MLDINRLHCAISPCVDGRLAKAVHVSNQDYSPIWCVVEGGKFNQISGDIYIFDIANFTSIRAFSALGNNVKNSVNDLYAVSL